MNSNKEIYKLI